MNYQQYLESDEWVGLRERAYERAGGKCELCSQDAGAVHHVRYPKDFRQDKLANVIVVCNLCHRKLHGLTGETAELAYYSQSITDRKQYQQAKCPCCGESNNHLTRVVVNIAGNISILENSGLRLLTGKPTGRGASVWLHFVCENGHPWATRWQFHKGATLTCVDKEPAIDFEVDGWTTLWRD